MPHNYFTLFFRYLALATLSITLVQGFKAPSNMNVSECLDLISHINTKPMSKPQNQSCLSYYALEPVLFEKLHNIKLSHLLFRVTNSFQLDSTKAAVEIVLKYAHDFDENMKALYSKLVINKDFDHKSSDIRQCALTYLALLKLCTDECADCKSQITQLTTQINNIFATLDQTGPESAKRGIIHSLFNFSFGDPNSSAEINAIKNYMTILEENKDVLHSQI